MAFNKSIKHTPGSRSGYLTELTASSGETNNFLLPVRIKHTPTNTCPLSDGNKNLSRMLQPVLIKDLLSSHKEKNNSMITSVSAQKKKPRNQRLAQPYLNTQSCYKPKNEDAVDSFSLSRKSFGGSKVRRQLYQALDSPQKFGLESKENRSKTTKPKKIKAVSNEDAESRTAQVQGKNRKSFLLPPNSMANSIMNKSETTSKAPGRQPGRSTMSIVNRQTKVPTRVTDTRKSRAVTRKSVFTKAGQTEDVESDHSIPDTDERQQLLHTKRDRCTMTSPAFVRGTISSTSTSDLSKLERPSVIMSLSQGHSASKNLNNAERPYLQNLNISKASQSFAQKDQIHLQNSQKTEFDFSAMNKFDSNYLMQFKSFLEHSIETCENQVLSMKQVLSFVNTMLDNNKSEECTKSNETPDDVQKLNTSSTFNVYHNELDATDIVEQSVEVKNLTFEADALGGKDSDVKQKESIEKMLLAEDKLPLPIKILVSDIDLKQKAKELLLDPNEMDRLSTIGEVSCEGDESENKENQSNSQDITLMTPKTLKRLPRRSSCESSSRRRSARLSAKRTSISELDDCDSFTMLEHALNVERPILSSKSLPASPMKPPMTPGVNGQWHKKIERPLKEYMALKVNGSFLVTPDVKRFQSCLELGPTDTPHSRKSLSRKIFMELCDLYGESPESK